MYVFGKNVVREMLLEDSGICRSYVSKRSKDQELINELKNHHIKIDFVDDIRLDRLVDGKHQGFVLEVDEVKTYSIDEFLKDSKEENPIVVLLDHLEDPHNFGAIIRTSEALGVCGIIIPNDRSVGINSTVVKTSAGAINHIKIVRTPNLGVAISKLKNNGYWIVGTDMKGTDYRALDYRMPICLVIGNEGHGMSKVVGDVCDFVASIPMKGKINSLNASVSCAIFLSEIINQRYRL